MKINNYLTFFVILAGLFCHSFVIAFEKQDVNDYFIYQNGKEQTVPVYNGVITLERSPFSLRFYNKKYNWDAKEPYVVKLSVLRSKKEWKKIKTGKKVEESLFFQGGSAFALTRNNNYNALLFSDADNTFIGGSHHLRYGEGENDLKTVLILRTDGLFDKMEFKIDTLFLDKKMVPVSDSTLPALYFAALNDKNLDGIIDEDELLKFVISFK